ncbi:MAG: GTPase HflX [Spirochaetaceae bacterium]|jgi:GTP-binding protein HflX|nr:GTPase HflX [Spirochaetaceae bacterium]
MYETQDPPKRVFLAGISDKRTSKAEALSLAKELRGLVGTMGLEIAGQEIIRLREYSAKYGIGKGKAEEIASKCGELNADCIILDWDLSPSQQRNWEDLTNVSTFDRRELIIQIFASRAQTREARLQVELARLEFSLPRLSHKYLDLARQRGGSYGAKGSGETKLESDRRLVQNKITKLKKDLCEIQNSRAVQRKKRQKGDIPLVALVGYTNAGKSSLLNALTGSDTFVADKLFATLDTTARRIERPSPMLLVDTVGFIRRLPHDLVDAFRSTLEEVTLADILIQVLDASDPDAEKFFKTSMDVLASLGAEHSLMITALNKTDCDLPAETLLHLQNICPNPVSISVKEGRGLEELMAKVEDMLKNKESEAIPVQ